MEEHLTSPAETALENICADLRAVGPPADIVLAYGKPAGSVTHLALYMAFAGIAREKPVVFLDGANSFDPFLISKIARRAGLVPEELLGRIHISRAFTCHQMAALVVERLAGALDRFNTNVAIVSQGYHHVGRQGLIEYAFNRLNQILFLIVRSDVDSYLQRHLTRPPPTGVED